jgi:hypothetical protein
VDAYLQRIKFASLFAFAAIGLYFFVGKARGKDILIGFLLALPYLLIVFFPSSWVSAMRGIALAQSLAFASILSVGHSSRPTTQLAKHPSGARLLEHFW